MQLFSAKGDVVSTLEVDTGTRAPVIVITTDSRGKERYFVKSTLLTHTYRECDAMRVAPAKLGPRPPEDVL